ncbi:MAG TPA: response regulator [Usitatibacter sp.]|nr:response regulator [Usitatibacter sp.]
MSDGPTPPDLEDLDFTELLGPAGPSVKPKPATPEVEGEGLIGERALKSEGYHVVLARERGSAREGKAVVLVVEDDDDTAALAMRALERGGYAVGRAKDSKETAAYLQRLVIPELILLDVELPGIDGFKMLSHLRAHPKLATVAVVMFTSRSSREDVVRGITLGADGYIAKPIAPKTLLEIVNKVLGR